MADDSVLRNHTQYKHLFEDKPEEIRPDVDWLKPRDGVVESKCGIYQVRKSGNPVIYSLHSVRIKPFARLIKDGFASFEDVKTFLRKGER